MSILEFVQQNPWQTFFLGPFVFILFWMVTVAFAGTLQIIFRIINRFLRTIKVIFRGWPPEHLDGDGDFRPKPKLKEEEK